MTKFTTNTVLNKYIKMNENILAIILFLLFSSLQGSLRLIPDLESISIVNPILTDATGRKISDDVTTSDDVFQADNIRSKRRADFIGRAPDLNEKIYISISHNKEEFLLELMINRNLITPHSLVEWVMEDGSKMVKKISTNCHYFGRNIKSEEPNLAAVSNCNGLTGYIQTNNQSYFIEPLSKDLRRALIYESSFKENNPYSHFRERSDFGNINESPGSHIIYSIKTALKKLNLSVQKDQEFMKFGKTRRTRRSLGSLFPQIVNINDSKFLKGGKRMAFQYKGSSLKTELQDKNAKSGISRRYSKINCKRHGKNGKYAGKIITSDDIICKERGQRRMRNAEVRQHRKIIKERRRREREKRKEERKRRKLEKDKRKMRRKKKKSRRKHGNGLKNKITNNTFQQTEELVTGPNLSQHITPKWLEIAVGIDHTMIKFHGEENVEKYVLTLFNIVSAIYADPSLDARLHIVILRLIFYKAKKYSQVKTGIPKKSLESVSKWATKLHSESPRDFKHDLAVWLTKYDLGGPSGYAPVSGICEPERSCTLNKDEGLTSAFTIAHEIGHVLGMSHDGDSDARNICESNGYMGSVMAPLVAANFGKFKWSSCSKTEYHHFEKSWHCLSNKPMWENQTESSSSGKIRYSLDDQCKMEFGEGFGRCRSYGMADPCTFLWCSNISTPRMCKTKQGPPLEGTTCGLKKWCYRGFCRQISKSKFNYGKSSSDSRNEVIPQFPTKYNSEYVGWGEWSEWEPCSRTCDIGISLRTRSCINDNSWNKIGCNGKSQEWKTCSTQKCLMPADLRKQQCQLLKYLVKLTKRKAKLTWLPYESRNDKKKCKLTCLSRSTNEVYIGRDNIQDGTKCSYDDPDRICVQGECITIGCDGSITSFKKTDACGVCGGDNSTCLKRRFVHRESTPKDYTEVITLPEGASQILIQEELPSDGFLTLKDSQSKVVHNGHTNREVTTEVILEGAKFHYKIANGKESISAYGPLLNPVIVLINGGKIRDDSIITTTYMMSAQNLKWEIGPYTPCSASCDGGMQQETLICKDLLANKEKPHSNCQHLDKPSIMSKTCNLFGCKFRWFASEWHPCSATCGASGVQTRIVSCIRSSILEGGAHRFGKKIFVNPILCTGQAEPHSERTCNRRNCPAYWEPREWSECSVTCGLGQQERIFRCVGSSPNKVYTNCESKPATEMRVCAKPDCSSEFCKEESKLCMIPSFKRFCTIPKYRKMCCLSCTGHT